MNTSRKGGRTYERGADFRNHQTDGGKEKGR